MPRRVRPLIPVLWLLAALGMPARSWAYEGEIRRDEPDAGVHVPVLTRPPELLEFVQAPYPEAAQAEGLTGSVKLAVTLGADGSVVDVQVMQPVGHGFDEAAVEAVKRFRFSPAEVDHVPAPVQIEYVYHFTLEAPKPREDAPPAPPPEGTLIGQLIERGSRSRVFAAMVRCGDEVEAPQAMSDEQGRFTLKVLAGTCDVRVVANGYELFKTVEDIPANGTLEVVYHLLPKAIGFETIVRAPREKKEVVRRTLERQELQKVPGTFGDPVRVVENLPGVARAPFGFGALIVRGASPDQTATLFDGVEIPLLYHFGGGPSVVNAEFLDRIDFFPGGFGAQYGRAVGGVVGVETRKGASDTLHGSVDVDVLDSGFFVEAPVAEGVSVAAAARRSYIDALMPFVLPQDPEGGSLMVLPRYWDYQLRVDFGGSRSADGQASSSGYVMAFGSDDLLSVVASGGARNVDLDLDVQTLFHRVKGDWTWRRGNMTSVFTPWAGYDLAGFSLGEMTLDANVWSVGGRETLTFELSKNVTARAGFDLKFEHLVGQSTMPVIPGLQTVRFPGSDPQTELQTIDRVVNGFDGALFGEVDLQLGPVTFTPGLRASAARLHGQSLSMLEPRLWVRYAPTDVFALKGSVGLYSQPPDPLNLEPAPLGTPWLQHEKAFQTSLGVEQRLFDVVTIDLTGYYNRRYDLIVAPGPREILANGAVQRFQYANDGLGRAYGLEVLLKHDITQNFFGWIAYTLNRSEQRRTNATNERDAVYNLTPWDQTHILTAVGSYRLPGGWELGARYRLVTGRPRTPLEHEADKFDADTGGFGATRGDLYSARFAPFHQLDVRIDRNFLFESWTLNVYLDVQNVYNARNVEATLTDYRNRVEVDVPGIPILPVIGVKGSF